MSLKAIHLVFITCATLLAAGLGAWVLAQRPSGGLLDPLLGIAGFATAAGLVVYGAWFVRKLKGVSYL